MEEGKEENRARHAEEDFESFDFEQVNKILALTGLCLRKSKRVCPSAEYQFWLAFRDSHESVQIVAASEFYSRFFFFTSPAACLAFVLDEALRFEWNTNSFPVTLSMPNKLRGKSIEELLIEADLLDAGQSQDAF